MQYADVIVDISVESLDKTYQYRIPKELEEQAVLGASVRIPFGKGNRIIQGYIVGLSEQPKFDLEKMKDLDSMVEGKLPIEGQLITLAAFIKENYGGTMNDALKTVIPVKKTVKQVEKKSISLLLQEEEIRNLLEDYQKKKFSAKVKLLQAMLQKDPLDFEYAVNTLKIPRTTIQALAEAQVITVEAELSYRNPVGILDQASVKAVLNEDQQKIIDGITADYLDNQRHTYLIHGVTGSGKTEVYMELISFIIDQGKQAILLIPEIALTYQTVMRFRRRFLDRVSILNSKMSAGERFDQIERAKKGEIDIMIGPRSALFTPFSNLGVIIIDEEHENSYKSEMPPKYHAREVAIMRALQNNAFVVLGSATPSLESFFKVKSSEYKLYELKQRAKTAKTPKIHIIDLKEELKNHNKSMFSQKLQELIRDRLEKKQQIMLFLNRRGFAGFVSCRSCGHVMKCPHCEISLTAHNDGKLRCHYCGYETGLPNTCPECNSKYIATFGTGTQKVEASVLKEFPGVRTLRMDADTTKTKNSYENILSAFANRKADILIGTQMIVKGHDFEGVTLVGILAADLSLYASDYRASERTFQLLAQAAGRAGRGELEGEVVIQTYQPEHYAITAASNQDYETFFENEITYRRLMKYPPVAHIMAILVMSKEEEEAKTSSLLLAGAAKEWTETNGFLEEIIIVGPAEANLSKVNDYFRRILYIKDEEYDRLTTLKDFLENYIDFSSYMQNCKIQFDFNPMNGY
jgi:primosomal protein N' (replication factor Y)